MRFEVVTQTLEERTQGSNALTAGARLIPAICLRIEPQKASHIIKVLDQERPLTGYPHLKRIKRIQATDGVRPDTQLWALCMLNCTQEETTRASTDDTASVLSYAKLDNDTSFVAGILGHGVFQVPRLAPCSMEDFEEANRHWPCSYHAKPPQDVDWKDMSDVYKAFVLEQVNKLVELKHSGVKNAGILIDTEGGDEPVVLVEETTRPSSAEAAAPSHPLKHTPMKILDTLGELQRSCMEAVGPSSAVPKQRFGSYLATGLDLLLLSEPCIMCAMGLLHSRIRRVFYVDASHEEGGLGSLFCIHKEPALNHHFSVYQYHPESIETEKK